MTVLAMILTAGFALALFGAFRMAQAAFASVTDTVPYTNDTGSAITIWTIVEMGSIFGVLTEGGQGTTGANATLADGETGMAAISGAFTVPKVSGTAFVTGDKLYWDSGNEEATKVAGSNKPLGLAADAAASAAIVCKCKINGVGDQIVADDFGAAGIKADVIAESTAAAGVTADGVLSKDATVKAASSAAALAADFVKVFEGSGFSIQQLDYTSEVLAAVSTDLPADIPKGAYVIGCNANVESALTGGGTTTKMGIGPAADPDKYGIAAALTKNTKADFVPTSPVVLAAAEDCKINACADAGGIGDTALTVGTVRVRLTLMVFEQLADAA